MHLLAEEGELGAIGKRRHRLLSVGFAAAIAVTVYVILDLEYPRLGPIRVDAADQALVELGERMR